jgi:hypothetical protein
MIGNFKRRDFIEILLMLSSFGIVSACGPESNSEEANTKQSASIDPCEDLSQLSDTDLQIRKGFGYVEQSPIDESHCRNCNLWKPPAEGLACGGCTLFKGPVYDQAYCTYWAPVV